MKDIGKTMTYDTRIAKVMVMDLSSGTEYHYSGIGIIDALINTYLLESNLGLQLHSPDMRDKVRNMVQSSEYCFSIGDFCTLKNQT